ncbi:DUF4199 domain-containing protein [Fulvivirgaceae bacterium BMA10]|uniref:DUF4199 domain-containing protein n=1 Tax=Splendidivirga corallicola TaxID=3051826 RepID=A0ABT8KPN3_9BACT|nr:DUF4199 domain-containing protein [Fulvivirgaceae bacterium BMA10]
MKNYVLRYGLLGGCVSIGLGLFNWFFIASTLGHNASQFIGYLSLILALFCIPLGIRYFRDKLNDGAVSFGEGFKIGAGITFITSLMVFLYSALFFVFAGDDFNAWREKGLTQSELEQVRQQMVEMPEFVLNPWFQGFVMFLMAFLIGMIINLISSLVLKSTNKSAIPSK